MAERKGTDSLDRLHRRAKALTGMPVTRRDAERALAACLSDSDMWTVIRHSHAPLRYTTCLWDLMEKEGLLTTQDGRLTLTEEGKSLAEALGIGPPMTFDCPHCDGRGVDVSSGLLKSLLERFRQIAQERPTALQKFDQGYVTVETTIARVAVAWAKGDLTGKSVIVLGDDDLVSIALALTGVCRNVLVIDIDRRLIRFIRQVARSERLTNLEAREHDLRNPLPDAWLGQFDTFLCDPTESFVGFKVFIDRGLLALKGAGSAGYFGLTRLESSLSKWQRIQQFLLSRGAVVTDIRDRFHWYENWDYVEKMRAWDWLPAKERPRDIWYQSALFRIELLRTPRISNEPVVGDIFTDNEAATT
ncbi:MAG: bis-aminopropyl spermidine synthase family protein [Armatimonadetes bacterium]|nr:bis-aminopropyl spermidine synthase family protein [Armatimonadota bacterium]MDW8122063.1 bis-aminopropyl spermidine synthase family protein [Armatimonadota bacterium]